MCHRMQARIPQYPMGQLPLNRVKFERPFLVVGIDYCGPLYIKEKKHRNTKRLKTYAALFVRFSTQAVHVELVSDLTPEAFLAALRRFFARCGKCTDIYSDNASTFTGANNKSASQNRWNHPGSDRTDDRRRIQTRGQQDSPITHRQQ
jgi:hypothetical protein